MSDFAERLKAVPKDHGIQGYRESDVQLLKLCAEVLDRWHGMTYQKLPVTDAQLLLAELRRRGMG